MKCYIKDYPRPQFVRSNWENLNGSWDFRFDDRNIGEHEQWYKDFQGEQKIQVPFTYETELSGIGEEAPHNHVWYSRMIHVDGDRLCSNRYMLHFEGSDFETKVWVNGQFAGSHKGGYSRFSFDITDLVSDGENLLVVKVDDSYDMQQPRGKQRWVDKNYLCFYVQTTGIWKTVWSEYVPNVNLKQVKMTPNMKEACLDLEYVVDNTVIESAGELTLEAEVSFKGEVVNKVCVAITSGLVKSRIDLQGRDTYGFLWCVKPWRPNEPNLYDITFTLREDGEIRDTIGSYFGMREIEIQGSQILLNGRYLYQRLILDQGYWKDSHLTPPSEEALIEDIDHVFALGYNGLRKHQKTEDERFLYWCDVKGMLVWCEAPSAYQFSDYAVNEFTTEWMNIVNQHYNHPSVITWTPFNESWGLNNIRTRRVEQHFTEAIYHLTKSIDPYRPVIVNDGWEHTVSDIITLHDYEESGEVLKERYKTSEELLLTSQFPHDKKHYAFANGYEYRGQPIMISEYGGIAFDKTGNGWGYGGKVKSEEDFLKRFASITDAIKEIPYVCGYCYTQITDVQQEINGLLDSERNFKIDPILIKEINDRQKTGSY